MATEVIMPKVDMVMETGTLVEWFKQEGDHVEQGEPLFVIMTDKSAIEIESPGTGTLAGVRAKPDDVVPVTEVIAYILEPGEALPGGSSSSPVRPAAQPAAPSAPAAPADEIPSSDGTTGKVRATPVARRMAAELGLSLAAIKGRGPRGRVQKEDVLAAAHRTAPASVSTHPQPAAEAAQPARTVPTPAQVPLPAAKRRGSMRLAGPRRIIAERMAQSAFTAPHITLALHVDMTEALLLRSMVQEGIEKRTGRKPSVTAVLARAVAAALKRHPYLNASLDGEEIVLWESVHLGIATSLDDYLVVPVVRDAQDMTLEELSAAMNDLVERARQKKLTPSEMSGSTFTISNLGMYGIESFTAIINPPESAILAVGKVVETPVAVDGEVRLRPLMNLTLSADHRIVDGAQAAQFLAELKSMLENPYLLI